MKNIFIFFLFLIAGCTTVKTASTSKGMPGYKEVASEKLGQDLTYIMNKSQTYVLCVKETPGTAMQPRNTLSYVVLRISDNKIVLEQKVDGTVGWYNDSEIGVFAIPGMMGHDQTKDDYTKLYNVETGKWSPKKGRQSR